MARKTKRPARTASVRHGAASAETGVVPTLAERIRPWLLGLVVAMFVARPLFPSEITPEAGDNLPLVMIFLLAVLVWLLVSLRASDWWMRFGVLDALVAVWIGWHTLASIAACASGSPRAAVNSLWLWVGYGAGYFLLRQLLGSRREVRALLVVMLALTVAVASYGLEQYFYEMPQTRAYYEQNTEAALRARGIAPDSPERQLFELRLAAVEPLATFALTNSLAGLLVPWLTVGVGLLLAEAQDRRRRWILAAGAGCLLLLAVCLLLTKSRSGFVAALVGIPLSWWAGRRSVTRVPWKWLAAATGSLVLLIGLAFAVGGLDKQVASEATKSLGYRFQYWQATLAMINDGAVFGRGPGQFGALYTTYKLPEASEEITDPHNFIMEVWVTTGTPALFLLAGVLGCFGWRCLNRASQEAPGLPETDPTVDATTAVFLGGLLGVLASWPLGLMGSVPPGLPVFWLGLPLAILTVLALRPWVREGTLPVRLVGVALAVLLVNLLAAGALEYAGVAGTFWLLLAVGMNLSETKPPTPVSRGVGIVFFGAALLIAVAGYGTGYAPVLARQTALEKAQAEPRRALEHLEAAVAADPWAVEPQAQRAAAFFYQALRQPTPDHLNQFLTLQEALFPLSPWSSSLRAEAGERYLQLFARTQDPVWSQRAAEVYQEAVRRYPTSAWLRAQLALAWAAVGQAEAASREAQEALRLHELTPHQDKKLPATLLDELRQGPLRNTSGAGLREAETAPGG